jgi:catalase (peroxidase I)
MSSFLIILLLLGRWTLSILCSDNSNISMSMSSFPYSDYSLLSQVRTNTYVLLSVPRNYTLVAEAITSLIQSDIRLGHLFLRLAWHLSGTYDKYSKNGGSEGGTIRLKAQLSQNSSKGLALAVDTLEKVHKKVHSS